MVMLTREKILETIRAMPDQFSMEELFEKIILLQKIDVGVEQSNNNQVFSSSQAKERLKKWLLK